MKKFLRALKEPVIPHSLWRTFVDAANNPDTTDAETALFQVRDTELVYMYHTSHLLNTNLILNDCLHSVEVSFVLFPYRP